MCLRAACVKDFAWKERNGEWAVENVPLGEGMVDFNAYYDLIATYGISGPISVHFEYEMPGEHGGAGTAERTRMTVEVMRRDLQTLRGYLSEANLG